MRSAALLVRSICTFALLPVAVAGCGPYFVAGTPDWFAQHVTGRAALARRATTPGGAR
jgi:hypothetical protein